MSNENRFSNLMGGPKGGESKPVETKLEAKTTSQKAVDATATNRAKSEVEWSGG